MDADPLRATLERLFREGAQAWPAVPLDPEAFRASVLRRTGATEAGALEGLNGRDLYLAVACELEIPEALAAFDRTVLSELPRMLGSLAAKVSAEEIQQQLRERLLVAGTGGKRIARYTGKGELAGFVRIAAVRTALDGLRGEHEAPASDSAILERGDATQDPELQFLKQKYARELADALPAALAALPVEERNLLRYHHLDGLSIDALAPLLGVHRASAARYLTRAREALRAALLGELEARLRVTPSELDSIVRLAQSELEISLGRMFRTPGPSTP